MSASPMKWAVVGAGAVGSYFGARLAAAGADVVLLARGPHLAAMRDRGLWIEGPDGRVDHVQVRVSESALGVGPVDVVLLCVKTWQLGGALPLLRPLLGPTTIVVTVQNGVDAPAEVASAVGCGRVLPGVVRIFADLDGPGRVRHLGGPASLVFGEWDGRPSERSSRVADELKGAGVSARCVDDVWTQLWCKVVFVVPLGGLGSALDLPIGQLRAHARTRRLLRSCMTEVALVASATGTDLPDDIVDTSMDFVDQQPARGTSSLHRDLAAGRPTELEAWLGAVVRLAERHAVPVPLHELLYESLTSRVRSTSASRPHDVGAEGCDDD